MDDVRTGLEQWLKRLTLRSALDAAACDAILNLPGRAETIPANRDFVGMGQMMDHSCLVAAGLAGRFGQTRDGQRQITALHIAGDMADLHSAVLPRAASALQSIGEVRIVRIPHAALKAVAEAFPALGEAFWRDCTVDSSVLSQWAVVNARLSALGRLAHLLCELACRQAVATSTSADIAYDLPMTQQHMADVTGLTSVHVNRMLRQLREAGLADVGGRRAVILDWAGLCRAGEFEPTYLHLHRSDH